MAPPAAPTAAPIAPPIEPSLTTSRVLSFVVSACRLQASMVALEGTSRAGAGATRGAGAGGAAGAAAGAAGASDAAGAVGTASVRGEAEPTADESAERPLQFSMTIVVTNAVTTTRATPIAVIFQGLFIWSPPRTDIPRTEGKKEARLEPRGRRRYVAGIMAKLW